MACGVTSTAPEQLQDSAPFTDPGIRRSSLAGVILQMQGLGLPRIDEFPFLDPPSRALVDQGYRRCSSSGRWTTASNSPARARPGAVPNRSPDRADDRARAGGVRGQRVSAGAGCGAELQDPQRTAHRQGADADAAHAQWRTERSISVARSGSGTLAGGPADRSLAEPAPPLVAKPMF